MKFFERGQCGKRVLISIIMYDTAEKRVMFLSQVESIACSDIRRTWDGSTGASERRCNKFDQNIVVISC